MKNFLSFLIKILSAFIITFIIVLVFIFEADLILRIVEHITIPSELLRFFILLVLFVINLIIFKLGDKE